jgi:uncharacterized protein YjdB
MVLLFGCGWNGTPTKTNDITPLTSIEISAVSSTIANLTSTRLTATGNYSGLYTRDITDQVVWSSNNLAVANFPASGRVKGVSTGTATLSATLNGVSGSYTLTVTSATATAVTITPAALSIVKGLTAQCSAAGTFSDGTTQDITVDAVWASADSTVATVANGTGDKRLVQAVAVGSTTISAVFAGVTGSAPLTVTEPVLQSLALSKMALSLSPGTSDTLTVTAAYSDGTTKDVTADAAWTSNAETVATVENSVVANKGRVTAVAVGSATISASYGGITVVTPAAVTVTNRAIQTFYILPDPTNVLGVGREASFTANVIYSDDPGKSIDVTKVSSWVLVPTSVVTLVDITNRPGVIKCMATGTATLMATFGVNNTSISVVVP